jgi:hypothetical protein
MINQKVHVELLYTDNKLGYDKSQTDASYIQFTEKLLFHVFESHAFFNIEINT